MIVFTVLTLAHSYYKAIKSSFQESIDVRRPIYEWIKENSNNKDLIFVWHEGFELYYMTQRKMATSFFSTSQHLTKNEIWEKNHCEKIEIPWEKFLYELAKDKPKIIVDLTPPFYMFQKTKCKKLEFYQLKFNHFINKNYLKEKSIETIDFQDKYKIRVDLWKRKN